MAKNQTLDTRITLRIDGPLRKRLQRLADRAGVTLSAFIVEACRARVADDSIRRAVASGMK